ncbi:MAG TPA: amino acid adenylation domain-containing protein [Labilithrix sp.]|nr:amino acid adenylation domain-containing protein [Labilithrix sp.]
MHEGARFAPPPIVRASRKAELPLSFAQQRMWFLDRFEQGSTSYNIPAAVRLSGPLDVQALAASLQEIVRRHEALRTTFPSSDGRVYQAINDTFALPLPVTEVQESEVRRLADEEAQKPFDLARGPLMRATLLRVAPQDHVLLLTMHHIVSDGWSMGVLIKEIGTLYEAFSTGRTSPLPELAIQYADYAAWQRQWLSGPVLDAQMDYWKRTLAGAPPALELPTDRPRPPMQTFAGSAVPLTLSRELSAGLVALSRREGVTLFMTLLAGFQALLSRYSGQDDIVVGSPIAARLSTETEGLIGLFVNTLALRTDVSADPTVRDLLGRVREVTLGAYAHQEVPFEKIVEELAPARDLSRTPLFQAMLVLQNTRIPSLSLGEVKLDVLENATTTAKFDLSLSLEQTAECLRGSLEYNTDLFDAATVERMLEHYRLLLEGMVADPARRVSEISLLTASEREKLLVEWNATEASYPHDGTAISVFEAQVDKTPDAIAVIFEERQLTYRELNTRANQLAHHLRGLGIGPDSLVGLCLERSLEMVVGIVGILKASAAYVPLDPTYPEERLGFMLEDSDLAVVLTQSGLVERLPGQRARRLSLDTEWSLIEREREDNPAASSGPKNLAYVMYTSGSTGRPKGVLCTHGGLSNRLHWMQKAFRLSSTDAVLQKTPFSFDVSVWEFLWPLMVGARLVVARPEGHRDGRYLVDAIATHAITTLHFVPSMLAAFLNEPEVERCTSLKRVICSGEVLPYELTQQFFRRSEAELWNLYGPTEASIDVTSWQCLREEPAQVVSARRVPIGRPIANTQVYVLDTKLQPVPVGVPGELCIGGVGVARGYLNRPELTDARFVPDPFRPEPGARLYKTGDRCRFRPDGNLEYLGRIDHQVKIRGLRIELGEIESVLGQHPSVREAVVLVREVAPGDKRLWAYLVARETSPPAVSELRNHLKSRLPAYMMPTVFLFLEQLPLSANGKVDRARLSVLDVRQSETDYVAPATATEEALAVIWSKLLGVERVSVRDNFFDRGGESLKAAELISAIERDLEKKLSVRDIFLHPTIEALAAHIAAEPGMPKPRATSAGRPDTGANYEWAADAVLDDDLRVPPGVWELPQAPRRILLTGATGHLGAHLLVDLVRSTDALVVCLVRATDHATARARVERSLAQRGLFSPDLASRIDVRAADVGLPRFGLSDDEYAALAEEVDSIYHSAAEVSFLRSYEQLRRANVDGTRELLRLAFTARPKAFHHISTTAVFDTAADRRGERAFEVPLSDECPALIGAYAASKWVAERLVTVAGERGLPTVIYRPAGIGPADGPSAEFVPSDVLTAVMFAIIDLGSAPDLPNTVADLSPADYVSRAVVALSLDGESRQHVFHLGHPDPISFNEYCDRIQRLGHPIERVSLDAWVARLREYAERAPNPHLAMMLPLFEELRSDAGRTWFEVVTQRHVFDASRAKAHLEGKNARCPAQDDRSILKQLTGAYVGNGLLELKAHATSLQHEDSEGHRATEPREIDVLVLTMSAGSGHNTRAEILERELVARGKSVAVVKLEEVSSGLAHSAGLYNRIMRDRPELYELWFGLDNEDAEHPHEELERFLAALTEHLMRQFRPRVVVPITSLATRLARHWKREQPSVRWITVVTDVFGGCLKNWGNRHVDTIVSPTGRNASYLVKDAGADPDRIVVGGYVWGRDWTDAKRLTHAEARGRIDLRPDLPTLLFNTYGSERTLDLLADLRPSGELQVAVLTYGVPSVLRAVTALRSNPDVHFEPVGFTDRLPTYARAADVVFTKPGPGLLVEAASLGAHCLIDCTRPIMPQEREGLDYFVERRLGHAIGSAAEFREQMDALVRAPDALRSGGDTERAAFDIPNGRDGVVELILASCP